jgi:hypothetical protein
VCLTAAAAAAEVLQQLTPAVLCTAHMTAVTVDCIRVRIAAAPGLLLRRGSSRFTVAGCQCSCIIKLAVHLVRAASAACQAVLLLLLLLVLVLLLLLQQPPLPGATIFPRVESLKHWAGKLRCCWVVVIAPFAPGRLDDWGSLRSACIAKHQHQR